VLAEALGAGEVVRATYLRHAFSRRFGQLAEQGALAQARSRYWNHLGHHVTGSSVTLCAIGVLIVGVYRIEAQQLTVGALIACSMLSARAVAMLAGLTLMASRWSELRRASRQLDELVADTDTSPKSIDAAAAQFSAKGNRLSLRNVRFEHDPARPLIEGLNLDVAPGEFVVLLGKPGAGKSTVLKLLGGLLRPSRGDAMLDGHSIADWPAELRARLLSAHRTACLRSAGCGARVGGPRPPRPGGAPPRGVRGARGGERRSQTGARGGGCRPRHAGIAVVWVGAFSGTQVAPVGSRGRGLRMSMASSAASPSPLP
jgi:ABC-type bacteriocin/lantibiotic exporter with double-glycine peptidase domain